LSDFDILIVGGGLVGLTLANILADTDWRVAVVDHQTAPDIKSNPNYDLRVSAINHASQAIFQSLNIWETLKQHRVSSFQKMQVWDANSPAKIQFDCAEVSQPYLGHIIEHGVIKQALWQRLKSYENVCLYYENPLLSLTECQDGIKIKLADKIMFSQLLVGADGAKSWVAKKAGLLSKTKSYQQSALVTTVRSQHSHQQTAWQRFLNHGPIALLPLADPHLTSLVWTTTPDQANYLQQMNDADFSQQLTVALEECLGKLEAIDQRLVFPLQESHALHYVKPCIALIGDAAHTLHPLAGQGVNLGLLDAACLAQVVQEAHQTNRDFASIMSLRRFERWRKGENTLMIKAMAGFRHCFANPSTLAKNARHWGFNIAAKVPPLKLFFIRRAMGLHGDLPQRAVFYENFG
jgi:2-polyprenylphenol 6-hydroxylase